MRRVCGFYVHKDSVFMCILSENGEKVQEKYGVLTKELENIKSMPGVKEQSATAIIAEIGVDMKMFLTAVAIGNIFYNTP